MSLRVKQIVGGWTRNHEISIIILRTWPAAHSLLTKSNIHSTRFTFLCIFILM